MERTRNREPELELTIEKLIYGGDGLARIPGDSDRSKAIFVPFVLEGEKVEVAVTEDKPGFSRARLERVLAPSPQRIDALCPYFWKCGGCHYQHTSYEHQLSIKSGIQAETLRRIAKFDPPPPDVRPSQPWNYRNRTRLKVRSQGAEFALGYFRYASHELLPVEQCPISSPLLNKGIKALWELGRGGGLAGVAEIELFANADDSALMVEFYSAMKPKSLRLAFERLKDTLPQLASGWVLPITSDRKPSVDRHHLFGQEHLQYACASANYRVSGGSFFQTNRHLVDELVRTVTEGQSGTLALDLYAGVGLFSLALAKSFERVIAVESAPFSHDDLTRNAPPNVRAAHRPTEQYLATHTKFRPDLVVVDPPRGGLGARATRALSELGPAQITYVSCDPATLARDLHGLAAAGYRIRELHLFDLFPQTFHIESVVKLAK